MANSADEWLANSSWGKVDLQGRGSEGFGGVARGLVRSVSSLDFTSLLLVFCEESSF